MKNFLKQKNRGFGVLLAIIIVGVATAVSFGVTNYDRTGSFLGEPTTINQLQTYKAKVSSNDSTPGYLNGKLVAGSNVTLTENTDGGNETLTIAATGGGGGSSIILDLGDDGGNDSTALGEVAITGDTNSIFTESAADKLLIAVGNDWPKSDTSDDLTCTDCIGTTEIADSYVLNAGDTMTGTLNVDGGDITLDNNGDVRFLELDAGGSNYKAFRAPTAITANTICTFEDDASFIPDSCVGDGTDAGGGDVTKVGTPVNNQIGVWTGDGTIEGDAALTFDTTADTLSTVDASLSNDLLLADGSIINWSGGNATITHVFAGGNVMTFAGMSGITSAADITVPDEAYGVGWNGNLEVPTKNALYDKIETISGGSFDSTTVDATTWSDGANASNIWTFDLSGTDTTLTFGSDLFTFNGGLTLTTGNNLILGTTQWNSGDSIDGESIANDTIDDDSIDFADVTGADLTLTDATTVTASGKITGNASLDIKNGATTSGVLAIFEDSDDGTNKATFQVPALAADTAYVLPADDGDSTEQLTTDGSGNLTWEAAGSGGVPTAITVANEGADTSSFVSFFTDATGDLGPKTNANFTFNAASGLLSVGRFTVTSNNFTIGSSLPFSDSAGTLTLQNIDVLDATTETTFESALDIAGDVTGTGLGSVVVAADAVALSTDTTGNYVSSATASGGLVLTGTEGGSLGVLLPAAADALSATTSSGSGLQLLSGGLTLLQGCSNAQVLAWVEAADTWDCSTPSGSGTVTATGGSLTSNAVVLGAGTTDTKVSTGITTNGTAQLVLGVNTSTIGTLKMFGNTSGDVTISPTAVAGTATAWTIPATSDTFVGKTTTDVFQNKDLTNANNTLPFCIPVAVSDEYSDLTAGTAKVSFRMPFAMTVTSVRASLVTVATGATLVTVDINEAGTTILSTKLTFDASELTTTTAATAAVVSDTALADDALMTVDVDSPGNTTPGNGLKISICGTI